MTASSSVWVQKACPIVLRRKTHALEILAFQHPLAGKQIVKGTIEPGESLNRAALRELREESGISDARIDRYLGKLRMCETGQVWHVVTCHAGSLPEPWTNRCYDDGGHDFAFFWHSLDAAENDEWHPAFKRVLDLVRSTSCV